MTKKGIIAVISVLLVVLIATGVYFHSSSENNDNFSPNFEKEQSTDFVVNKTSDGKLMQLKFGSNNEKLTVEDLKKEFLAAGVDDSSKYIFKPFYNVEQNTEFTFHFNSKVDPVKSITVHTDEKCEYASLVWQMNDAYWTENGIDVVVKPSRATLYTDGRTGLKNNVWGYAPMYYICIRYDLDSKEVKKLEKPIIIPFTVKSAISTPTVYASVDENGIFSVKWNAVDGAVSYKIYGSSKNSAELSPSESGYTGNLKLLTTLKATELEYNPGIIQEKNQILGTGYEDNTVRKTIEEYKLEVVTSQNSNLYNHSPAIYITAVDSNGNESNFGFPVDISKYKKTLPYKVKNFDSTLTELPETVSVVSADSKTIATYPVNFYKLEEKAYASVCYYKYEVVGTKLTGVVGYKNENKEFPNEKISNYKINTSSMPQSTMDLIPEVTVNTFADEEYSNSKVDLQKKIDYPAEAKVQLDSALIVTLIDKDLARRTFSTLTSNAKDPREEFESFVASDNPEYVLVREGTTLTVKKVNETNKIQEQETNKVPEQETNKVPEQETNKVPEQETNKVPEQEANKVPEQETNKVPEQETNKVPEQEVAKPAKEIDNSNYVEEQQKSTEKQVTQADKEEIEGTKYPVHADTPAQLYLTLALINQEPEISLKAFPEYQVLENLADDLLYVWYQNPYIMGIDINLFEISNDGLILKPKYNVSKATAEKYQEAVYEKSQKVAKEIIKDGMTDYDKVIAIYDYLEDNAKYNEKAIELFSDPISAYATYPNSWNTYGILCEGVGVCQSYAYAFNSIAYFSDLETVMVTGYMNGGGHAWNAVKLSNKWYMVDATNNGSTSGVPYWICNASTDYIGSVTFVLDDGFVDGTNVNEYINSSNEQDWYYKNGFMAQNIEELANIWEKNKNTVAQIWIKYLNDEDPTTSSNLKRLVSQIQKDGYSIDELDKWNVAYASGLVCFKKGE